MVSNVQRDNKTRPKRRELNLVAKCVKVILVNNNNNEKRKRRKKKETKD